MALDYRSMRDATQMATAMELAKAQNIGQSAASLGHAGGLAWKEIDSEYGGLMNFLKGIKKPKEELEDASEGTTFMDNIKGFKPNVNLETRTPYSLSNQITTDAITMPAESTGRPSYGGGGISSYGGGAIPSYGDDAKYDYYAQKYGGQQSGVDKALASGFQLPNQSQGSGVIDPSRGGPVGVLAPEEEDSNLLASAMGTGNNTQQSYLSNWLPKDLDSLKNAAYANIGASRDSMLGLAQATKDEFLQQAALQKANPTVAGSEELDREFGQGYSYLPKELKGIIRDRKHKRGGTNQFPFEYHSDTALRDWLAGQNIDPAEGVVWENY